METGYSMMLISATGLVVTLLALVFKVISMVQIGLRDIHSQFDAVYEKINALADRVHTHEMYSVTHEVCGKRQESCQARVVRLEELVDGLRFPKQ